MLAHETFQESENTPENSYLSGTIREALKGELTERQTPNHRIYVISNNETTFYVGQSVNPIVRLKDHLGTRRFLETHTGLLLFSNLPQSLDWQFTVLTLNECTQYVEEYISLMNSRLRKVDEETGEVTDPYPVNPHTALGLYKAYVKFGNTGHKKIATDMAEIALIRHLHPCMNKMYNPYRVPLPRGVFNPFELDSMPVLHPFPEEYLKWLVSENRDVSPQEHAERVVEAWTERYVAHGAKRKTQ